MERFLDKKDTYITKQHHVSLVARIFPTIRYYSIVLPIIFRTSSNAKRYKLVKSDMHGACVSIMKALESTGGNIEITGINYLREYSGTCILLANHMSTLDTLVLPAIIWPFKDFTFIVKRSLLKYPFFRHIMCVLSPIGISRTSPRYDFRVIMSTGMEKLSAGESILIFPQGIRTTIFAPEDFSKIGIKLAKKANVPIIPIALKTDACGIGKFFKDFGKIDPSRPVHFAFGEPLWVKGDGKEEHKKVVSFIAEKLKEWE